MTTPTIPSLTTELAGEFCKVTPHCIHPVKFGVTPAGLPANQAVGACAQHLSHVVVAVFDLHGVAAVVREVAQVPRRRSDRRDNHKARSEL